MNVLKSNPFHPLVAIVCGFEKSGTTLLNEILRRHPDLDSGFEGGLLLGSSPRDFKQYQPYYAYFRKTWELSREDMLYICDTDAWGESYRRARERCPFITNKNSFIFDKTPIYMKHLSEVMAKVPGLPCVVNVRDPRALLLSWANWSGHKHDAEAWLRENFSENIERYASYAEGYLAAEKKFAERLYLNQFERMCINPAVEVARIFNFLGFDFETSFLNFSSKHFVYGNDVSTEYLFPYLGNLSEDLCGLIVEATSAYRQWHVDPQILGLAEKG